MNAFDNYLCNQVIKLYNQGLTQEQIADRLNIPTKTVELIIIREYY